MITLSKEDVRKIVGEVYLPTLIESPFLIEGLTCKPKILQVDSLQVVGVYKVRKQTWFNKFLRYYDYDLIGIRTPTMYCAKHTSSTSLADIRSVAEADGDVMACGKNFKLLRPKKVSEIILEFSK